MSTTEKRHDIIADTLTIREMASIIDGLTLLTNTPASINPERTMIWELRRLISEAHTTAMRNEYAGDYDYPDDAE